MLNTIVKTREFTPAEVIPAVAMAECGEKEMQIQFAYMVKGNFSYASVNGWTVTLTARTDDEEFMNQLMDDDLNSIPAMSINAFT